MQFKMAGTYSGYLMFRNYRFWDDSPGKDSAQRPKTPPSESNGRDGQVCTRPISGINLSLLLVERRHSPNDSSSVELWMYHLELGGGLTAFIGLNSTDTIVLAPMVLSRVRSRDKGQVKKNPLGRIHEGVRSASNFRR